MICCKLSRQGFFIQVFFILFLVAIGTDFYINIDTLRSSETFGKVLIVITMVPFFVLYLLVLIVRFIDSPKTIRLDFVSEMLFIDDKKLELSELESLSFSYKKERIYIEVIFPKDNILFKSKINYLCNMSIDEIDDNTSEIENVTVYHY
ncbi:hypothetical protein TUM4261_28940 [Shewanella sp. c952]|nr:hypothetical protein TUM4261_28940 [Shewanella sp. c952]